MFFGKNSDDFEIHGSVSSGFEAVREEFSRNFENGIEEKAQCCAYVGNEKVVDLWGQKLKKKLNRKNENENVKYDGDSMAIIFSSTKSVTAIVFATLVDQGLADYNDKVSTYWPEFAQNGKENVTFESILKHQSGMARIDLDVSTDSFYPENLKKNVVGAQIEKMGLRFPDPKHGTDRQYHSMSRGIILNEIFRRIDKNKRTIGESLRQDISKPLDIDVHIGSLSDEERKRFANLESWGPLKVALHQLWPSFWGSKIERGTYGYLGDLYRTFKISKPRTVPWTPEPYFMYDFSLWHQDWCILGELPSSCAIASARGLAKLAAAMANRGSLGGVQILKPETWEIMHSEKCTKKDVAQNIPGLSPITLTKGGVVHFTIFENEEEMSTQIRSYRDGYYGWYGMGGSVFQWHPDLKIGFAYVPTLMAWYDVHNLRGARLQKIVADCARKKDFQEKRKQLLSEVKI